MNIRLNLIDDFTMECTFMGYGISQSHVRVEFPEPVLNLGIREIYELLESQWDSTESLRSMCSLAEIVHFQYGDEVLDFQSLCHVLKPEQYTRYLAVGGKHVVVVTENGDTVYVTPAGVEIFRGGLLLATIKLDVTV